MVSRPSNSDYDVEKAIFDKSFNSKFATTTFFLNPEFRYAAEVGPCETFDDEGVKKLLKKFKEAVGCQKITPFDGDVKVTDEERRRFLSEVLDMVKLCLRLACAERGYEYKNGKLYVKPISPVWADGIDPMAELKTLKAILGEMREPLMKDVARGQESRFWDEADAIFETVLPALDPFDSKVEAEKSEEAKKKKESVLKPLSEAKNQFLQFYTREEWDSMPARVRAEIIRQRDDTGFIKELGTAHQGETRRRANGSPTVAKKGTNNYNLGYRMTESDRIPDKLWFQLSREERIEIKKKREESARNNRRYNQRYQKPKDVRRVDSKRRF